MPRIVDFHSTVAPAVAVSRIAALCMPRDAASLASRWLVGSPTVSSVRLQWHVKGSRAMDTAFVGRFVESDGRVVLRGRFERSLGDQAFNLAWVGGLAVIFVACLVAGSIHGDVRALAGALLSGCLLAVAAWLARVRGAEEAADIAWVSAALREALAGGPEA